jgi:DNA-binding SARP family transcriptional activator
VTGEIRPGGNLQRAAAPPAVPSTKLRPVLNETREVAASLARSLEPRAGGLVLVHAAAGYGKTTALAMTQQPGWHWYNLDGSDRSARILATRLCSALGIESLPPNGSANGEAVALELANRLEGRALTITFDRYQQLGHAPEVGRMLGELLVLLPTLALRIATRTRPALPLERLRLEGRLVEVETPDLRLPATEISQLLAKAWGRPPNAAEAEFADSMLGGWPGAIVLWLAGLEDGADLMAPLQPGKPLHDYLHEELLQGTLSPSAMDQLRAALPWLVGEGPVLERLPTPDMHRLVIEVLIRDRVGVVPGPGGWHLHPLVNAFLALHVAAPHDDPRPQPTESSGDGEPGPPGAEKRVVIRTLGGLAVEVDGLAVPEAAWPTASRRLLELFLCLPGGQGTADQAAGLLWPRHLPRSAQNSFNVALHGLRRVLEPDLRSGSESRYVVREGRGYRLRLDQLDCDAEDFERLVRRISQALDDDSGRRLEMALERYGGDFLASSTEDFVRERRDRLRRLMLEALQRLGEWHTDGRRQELALSAFSRLLELAPQREDIWARVLELHLAAGDEHRALAVLHQCEESLQADGIEPSGLLKELRRRIRREAPPDEDDVVV